MQRRRPIDTGEVPGLPRKFPELLRKFSATSSEVLSLWNLTAIQRFPGSFPHLPRKFPKLPGKFRDFPGGQPLSVGSLTPSPESQKVSLITGRAYLKEACDADGSCIALLFKATRSRGWHSDHPTVSIVRGLSYLRLCLFTYHWSFLLTGSSLGLFFGKDQKGIYRRGIHDQGDFWKFLLETAV